MRWDIGGLEVGQSGGFAEVDKGTASAEGVRPDNEILGDPIFGDEMAYGTDSGRDLGHRPAGKAVEARPVLAHNEVTKMVDQIRSKERPALLLASLNLGEKGLGESRLRGELAHHLRQHDSVGRHRVGG